MSILHRVLAAWIVCGAVLMVTPQTTNRAIVAGFDTTRDVRNDDGTWTAPSGCTDADDGGTCAGTKIDLGFTVNFFGLSFSQLYVNTNGNITFDGPLASYTPFDLTSANRQIIAPFFADVDTRNPQSGTTTFGKGTFGGRAAFGVTWTNAGYYYQRADKRNSFQVILVERSDTGAGNFDIVFNYDSIQWETGEAQSSGGVDGLGGRSARAGYSNGTGISGTALELRGSAIPGSFLDSNAATGLIRGSLNSDIPGRYVFFARNGQIISGGLGITGPCPLPAGFQGVPYPSFSVSVSGGTPPYTVTSILPPGLTLNPATLAVSGTPTASGEFPISITVTDSAPGVLQQTRVYTCTISIASAPPPLNISGPCAGGLQNRPYWTQLSITGGTGSYSVSYSGPSWLAPAASAPVPGVFSYSLAGTPPQPGTFPASVTVRDSFGTASTYLCAISVAPSITITSACPASPIRADVPYRYQFQSLGGGSTAVWSVVRGRLPAGLILAGTGQLFGTPDGPPSSSTFTIAVRSGEVSDEKTCSLAVEPPPLRIASGCPWNGAVGVPYAPFPLSAAGGLGTSTYRFSMTGNVPEGLSIANNTITGRPESAGAYTFRIQVTSGDQTVTSAPCTVEIGASPLDIAGSCPALSQRAEVPVSASFAAAGGLPPYHYILSGPAWLSQSNGVVSGIPPADSQGGNVTFRLAAFDSAGVMNSRTCTFNVGPPPVNPTIAGTCPGSGVIGETVSVPLVAAGGQSPYAWSYNGGVSGLALESATGSRNSLKGTLDETGEFTFTIGVMDSAGVPAQPFTCTVAVVPPAAMRLSAGPMPADLLTPVPIAVTLAEPAAAGISGTVRLKFSSTAAFPADNPEVTLSSGNEVPFQIPAGSTSVSLGNVQRGTVAGSIRLEVTNLEGADGAASWPAMPELEITVPRAAPVFSVAVEDIPGGIEIVLKGYSTTRDITGGRVTIHPRSGAAIPGAGIDLAALDLPRILADYYGKGRTGAFDNIRISIPVEGGADGVEAVTIELTNSAGTAEVKRAR